jgi:hypothetical protein
MRTRGTGRVPKKRHNQTHLHLTVVIRYITANDAEARLAQAINLLLKSAAMNGTEAQEITDSNVKHRIVYNVKGSPGERIIKDKG